MTSACCTAILFASVVWGIGQNSVTQENGCKAAQVIEGGTGVMNFFLRKDINMSSDDLFANLRRGSDSDTDIVRCFPHNKTSPVDCTSVDVRYLTDGLANNSITVSIPNVTREFEDTYTLRVYVNDKAESAISCSLEVIAFTAPKTPHYDTGGTIDNVVLIAAVAGSLGTLIVVLIVITCICCLRKCRRSKKAKKKDATSSFEKEETFILMPVPANKKRSEKAADRLMPLNTPSTASDVIGTSPRIETNHTPEQDEFRRRKGGTSEEESIYKDSCKSTASPLMPEANRNSWKQKDLACQQWYFRDTTLEQAHKWLLAAGNQDGSFLVIDSIDKPGKYILKVKFYGEVKNRFIFADQSGFRIEPNCHFPTVTDLIEYYCKNAGCLPAKLSVPCSRTS